MSEDTQKQFDYTKASYLGGSLINASEDIQKPFEYTKASYWGGSQISPNLLKTTALLGGFFGFDHFLLRSPQTGILKAIVNFFTLGFWYFYDLIQVFSDMSFVREFGYTLPGYGPSGIGRGMVYAEDKEPTAPEDVPNPIYFMLYAAMIAIPFGFSNFIAGDYYGGAAKLVTTLFPFTFLIGLIWTMYSTYTLAFKPESLFKEGTDRIFPFTTILGPNGPAPKLLNPKKEEEEKEISGLAGFFLKIFGFIAPFLGPFGETFFGKVSRVAEKGVKMTCAEQQAQTGGALETMVSVTEETGSSISQIVFIGTALSILLGAVGLTAHRVWKGSKPKEQDRDRNNDLPPEVSDVPPSGPRPL